VRTACGPFDHHVRLPGYARGKVGHVESVHGMHVFPDTHAHGQGEQPQWLYTVAFEGTEVWGEGTAPGLTVCIDAFEPYLQPVA
jgi:nitrile hydratase